MPEPAQPGRARVCARAVVERMRARRRVRKDGMALRLLGECYRIFEGWWRWCFVGFFVKNGGWVVVLSVVKVEWLWWICGWV
jgi:hypothetical protein